MDIQGCSRAREMKYARTVDLYWHLTSLVGQVWEEKDFSSEEHFIHLKEIKWRLRIKNKKYDAIAKDV